jgi:iron complex outermembrane recepter protein
MNRQRNLMRRQLRGGAAFCALALPSLAFAQSATMEGALEEVVVTAEKRETSLQKTPIAVSAMTSNDLERRGVDDIPDLVSGSVPSLRIVPSGGRTSNYIIGMRGIVPVDSAAIQRDPSVGIYLDGVYLGRSQGLGSDLFELERMEVLRGPQGTLFGRNAVGGALSLISKKPTGEFGYSVTLGLRNYDGVNGAIHLNLPEWKGVSVKVDAMSADRDGTVENTLAGQADWNQYRRHGYRIGVLWEPTDTLAVNYAYDESKDKSTGGYATILELLPGAPPLAPMFSVDGRRRNVTRAGVPLNPSIGKVDGHALNVAWDVTPNIQLRSITAYRTVLQTQSDNTAGAALAFRPNGQFGRVTDSEVDQEQFSQEFQAVGNVGRVAFALGAFYFDEDADDFVYTKTTNRFNATGTSSTINIVGGPFPDRATDVHARSKALYGQATWTPEVLEGRLHLTGGLRYTEDDKRGMLLLLRGAPTTIGFVFSSKRVDPAVVVAYDFSDDVNAYVRWGTAYRSGGANSRAPAFTPFDEEEVESWEVGLKSQFWDRRARLNLAAYHSTYRDMQIDFFSPLNLGLTVTSNGVRNAKIKGLEVDASVAPITGLRFDASYSYTDPDVPNQPNPFSGLAERVVITQTPKHAATVSADYEFPELPLGVLSAHADMNYSSGFFSVATDTTRSQSYALVNARITLRRDQVAGGRVSLSVWGKNLTNIQYDFFDNVFAQPGTTFARIGLWNEPRTYGVELNYRY